MQDVFSPVGVSREVERDRCVCCAMALIGGVCAGWPDAAKSLVIVTAESSDGDVSSKKPGEIESRSDKTKPIDFFLHHESKQPTTFFLPYLSVLYI
jgi:hypothetical protein